MPRPFIFGKEVLKEWLTVVVKVKTIDGIVGYGEAPILAFPYIIHETIDTCMLMLRNHIAPLVIHKQFSTVNDFVKLLINVRGGNIAKASVEMAVYMIQSLENGVSLKKLIGGKRNTVIVGKSVAIQRSIRETLEVIQANIDAGFEHMRIMIRPGWDLKVIDAIRIKYEKLPLIVDGYASYTIKQLKLFQTLDQYKPLLIEQPLMHNDLVDHALLQSHISTPICLDESILSFEDARKAIAINACKVINIKPFRVGGLWESNRIYDLCVKHNTNVICSGMIETSLGLAYSLALSSLPDFSYPNIFAHVRSHFLDDLTDVIFEEKSILQVPDSPGLGIVVDEKKLEKYAVGKVFIS